METAGNHEAIVKKLRRQISKRWPESLPKNFDNLSTIPTNIPDFDSILPKGGLPAGELIQISGARSSGKTYFLFKILSGLKNLEGLILYFDLTGEISPQVIKLSGLDSTKFIHIRSENVTASLRAAEVLFVNREIKFVVFDLVGIKDNIPKALLLRLKRVIKKSKGIAFFLTNEDYQSSQSSLIRLKLKVTRISFSGISSKKASVASLSERLSVTLEKNSFGKEGKKVELVFYE
jgi:hypothetical protein